ncbi:DNA-processing protein DprA [Hornefia butyriciproducens]|nr:DNA-processing protein DprA [Hornefia butyriciproducens]
MVGNARINKEYCTVLQSCENVDGLIKYLSSQGFSDVEISNAKQKAVEEYYVVKNSKDTQILTVFDESYPAQLNCMKHKKPVFLYARGNVELLNTEMVAVVGTRKPSDFTEKVEKKIVKRIIDDYKLTILSGLALGCDAVAHDAALHCNGSTIAVLPSGLDNVSPKRNIGLAERIIDNNGLLLSEYPNNFEATKYTPLARDEIVAGLSGSILVIECSEESGTMQTVKFGNKYNKVVGTYVPSDASMGDYSGNIFIIDNKMGISINSKEKLPELFKKNKDDTRGEQLMIF